MFAVVQYYLHKTRKQILPLPCYNKILKVIILHLLCFSNLLLDMGGIETVKPRASVNVSSSPLYHFGYGSQARSQKKQIGSLLSMELQPSLYDFNLANKSPGSIVNTEESPSLSPELKGYTPTKVSEPRRNVTLPNLSHPLQISSPLEEPGSMELSRSPGKRQISPDPFSQLVMVYCLSRF